MTPEEVAAYYRDHPAARWYALVSVCLAIYVTLLTFSAVNVAIPAIARDLEAEALLVGWVPTAFLLANAIFLLPSGRLADIHGRKRLFLVGTGIYTLGCVLASLATSMEMVLAMRFFQGLGTAMLSATSMALVVSIFGTTNRGTALGFASASIYLGLASGPLFGGWFTELFGWRSVFLFQLPLTLVSTTLIVTRLKGEWTSSDSRRVDWLGAAIFALWASAFFGGISLLPHPMAAAVLLVAAFSLVAFVVQQFHSSDPLLRFRAIWSNRVYSRSLIACTCLYAANYPMIFLLSLYLQYILGLAPGEAGVVMIVQAITMALLAPISGRLSDTYEPRVIATVGCLASAIGFTVLQTLGPDTPLLQVAFPLVLLGIGIGLFSTPNNNAAMGAVPTSKLSIASATLSLARVMGNMVGTANVLLLMALIVGNVRLDPAQYPALLDVVLWAMRISFAFALLAAWFSFSRGELRPE